MFPAASAIKSLGLAAMKLLSVKLPELVKMGSPEMFSDPSSRLPELFDRSALAPVRLTLPVIRFTLPVIEPDPAFKFTN
jgi:hypothetical protein